MSRIYVDTSALIKRARDETESQVLRNWLKGKIIGGAQLFTSDVTLVEVERALRALSSREAANDYPISLAVQLAVAGISVVPLDGSVLRMARWIGPDSLRTLDALHLATAVLNGAVTLITYDRRLAAAAESVKLTVESPR